MIDVSITLKAEDSFLKALNAIAQIFTSAKSGAIELPKENTASAPITQVTPPVSQSAPIPTTETIPPVTQSAPIQAAPITQPSEYTLEQLSYAAAPLMDAGKMQELIGVMQEFGVKSLQELPKDKYGLFATRIRTLGAKI